MRKIVGWKRRRRIKRTQRKATDEDATSVAEKDSGEERTLVCSNDNFNFILVTLFHHFSPTVEDEEDEGTYSQ